MNLDTSDYTEEQQLGLMDIANGYYAYCIREFMNPSERVQLRAVFHRGYTIQWIENPSEAVQMAAIRHDPMDGKQEWNSGMNIQYIKHPTPKVQAAAVEDAPKAIQFITDPPLYLQERAIQWDPSTIEFIKNPTPEMQLRATMIFPDYIRFIENPTQEVQLRSVSLDPRVLQYIKNPSVSVLLAAGKMTKRALRGNSSFFYNARIPNTVHHNIFNDHPIYLSGFCTGTVSLGWQEDYMRRVGSWENYWGIIVYDVDRPGYPDKVVGYAVFHIDYDNDEPTGYTVIDRGPRCNVDLLCCNQAGIGSYTVWTIEEFVRDKGVQFMVSTPVPASHPFRRKLGYMPVSEAYTRGHRPQTRSKRGTSDEDEWWFKWMP